MVTKINTSDLSLENMIGSLFGGNSKGAYAIESEELFDGGELTTEELNVLEDDEADPAFLGEEALRHISNARSLSIGLQAAESFLWNKKNSKENDDGVIIVEKLKKVKLNDDTNLSEEERTNESDDEADTSGDNIWKKFCNWIKGIFTSIRMGIITFFKKVQIWMAGDMKRYGEWFNEHKENISKIEKSKVTLKIRPLSIDYDKFYSDVKKSLDDAGKFSERLAVELKQNFWEKMLHQKVKVDTKNLVDEEVLKNVAPEHLKETLYGSNTPEEVTAEDFFKKFKIHNLSTAADVKTYLKESQSVINQATVGIKTTDKVDAITDEDARKAVKAFAGGLEKSIGKISTGLIWLTSAHIQLLNTSIRFGNAAIKEGLEATTTEEDKKKDKSKDKPKKSDR